MLFSALRILQIITRYNRIYWSTTLVGQYIPMQYFPRFTDVEARTHDAFNEDVIGDGPEILGALKEF
jgi:hypothetical protein